MAFIPPEGCVAVRRIGTQNALEDSNTPSEGIVVFVGHGAEFMPPQVRIGERVYFGPRAGIEIDFDDGTLIVLAETELLRDTSVGRSSPYWIGKPPCCQRH
jgi:co-chaperonin GroES (HSP10)